MMHSIQLGWDKELNKIYDGHRQKAEIMILG